MNTTEGFKELRISAADDGTFSIIVDGSVKERGLSWPEVVIAVRSIEEAMNEQVQQ